MTNPWYNWWVKSTHGILTGTAGGLAVALVQIGSGVIAAIVMVFLMIALTVVYTYIDVYGEAHAEWIDDRINELRPWAEETENTLENDRIEVEWPPNRAS